MKKILLIVLALLVFTACGNDKERVWKDDKIHVTTTVGMLADMVENIGGDRVAVESLMGPGVDPHLYQPSAGDIGKLEDADLVVYVGLHLEGKMVEIFESLERSQNTVAVGEHILDVAPNKLLKAAANTTGTYDPHVWFDVSLWSNGIDTVLETLIELDPDSAELYTNNAEIYRDKLAVLHDWVGEQIKLIPEGQRILVTAHDAFSYFGKAYGVEVRGLQGISTSSDYGLKDLENLINFIVEKKIKAVFVESSVPTKSIDSLREGVRAKGWDLQNGGQLFSDAMGQPNTPEGTYVGMVEHNVNTIVNALK